MWGPMNELLLAFGIFVSAQSACGQQVDNASTLNGRVNEQTIRWDSSRYSNPWEQVSLVVDLTSPGGRVIEIGGFYYATDTWMFRFAPNEPGLWVWKAALSDGTLQGSWEGTFTVDAPGGAGFIRQSPVNPYRWVVNTGGSDQPYYPVGINDCVFNRKANINEIDPDGPIRFWLDQRIVEKEEYFQIFSQAGVNLFRWGPDNCSVSLYDRIAPEGNFYRETDGKRIDEMLRVAGQNKIKIYQVLFGFNPPFAFSPTADQMSAVKRYLKYMVDRYGALVDFWELMNEARADNAWYTHATAYLRSVDVYQHPISTSLELPQHAAIDINSPHWYQLESENDSDLIAAQNFQFWKSFGKPVIVGEQGNMMQSWDDRSGLRMRLRLWATMFSEGALAFWNSSRFHPETHIAGEAANIYLGPEERSYIRVLQAFSSRVPVDALSCSVSASSPLVRAYALCGQSSSSIYLHAYGDHSQTTTGLTVAVAFPRDGQIEWIQPATGDSLRSQPIHAGLNQVEVPDFIVDLAGQYKAGEMTAVAKSSWQN